MYTLMYTEIRMRTDFDNSVYVNCHAISVYQIQPLIAFIFLTCLHNGNETTLYRRYAFQWEIACFTSLSQCVYYMTGILIKAYMTKACTCDRQLTT